LIGPKKRERDFPRLLSVKKGKGGGHTSLFAKCSSIKLGRGPCRKLQRGKLTPPSPEEQSSHGILTGTINKERKGRGTAHLAFKLRRGTDQYLSRDLHGPPEDINEGEFTSGAANCLALLQDGPLLQWGKKIAKKKKG